MQLPNMVRLNTAPSNGMKSLCWTMQEALGKDHHLTFPVTLTLNSYITFCAAHPLSTVITVCIVLHVYKWISLIFVYYLLLSIHPKRFHLSWYERTFHLKYIPIINELCNKYYNTVKTFTLASYSSIL